MTLIASKRLIVAQEDVGSDESVEFTQYESIQQSADVLQGVIGVRCHWIFIHLYAISDYRDCKKKLSQGFPMQKRQPTTN